jgi:predicted Zn-dependent protease
VEFVTRARIDPRGIPRMFRVLLDERKSKPAGVEAWFTTHPLEESRIRETESLIARLDAARLASFTTDTPAYRAFRERLLSLPSSAVPRPQ